MLFGNLIFVNKCLFNVCLSHRFHTMLFIKSILKVGTCIPKECVMCDVDMGALDVYFNMTSTNTQLLNGKVA